MRLVFEALLLLSGALLLALGVGYLGSNAISPADAAALTAAGVALTLAGGVLTLRLSPVKAPALNGRIQPLRSGFPIHPPLAEPLAVVHLAWNGSQAPLILGASPQAVVVAEEGGVVRIALRTGSAIKTVICRADRHHPAYFNTLKRTREDAAIKLVAPIDGQARLEFWDEAALA